MGAFCPSPPFFEYLIENQMKQYGPVPVFSPLKSSAVYFSASWDCERAVMARKYPTAAWEPLARR